MKHLFFTLSLAMMFMVATAQSSSHQYITVVAEPDHDDWTYHTGEQVNFTAYAIKENVRMKGAEITYSYGPDKLDAVKTATIKTGTLQHSRSQGPRFHEREGKSIARRARL